MPRMGLQKSSRQLPSNADDIAVSTKYRTLEVLAELLGFDGTTFDRIRAYNGGILKTARAEAGLSNSGVKSGDALIKTGAGKVYWVCVSDTAALAVELNDSTDGAGTDKWALDLPADGYCHYIFDPPIEFATGIYLDVSTGTCKVTIGYL